MLSSDTRPGDLGAPRSAAPVSRPSYFKRRAHDVVSAQICFGAKVQLPRTRKASAKMGLRFEGKVLDGLSSRFGERFSTGVPISFQEFGGKPGYAIPDGMLLSPCGKQLLVVEIKLRHLGDAYYQLNEFYLPILRRALRGTLELRALEICQHYDPAIRLPKPKCFVVEVENCFVISPHVHPVMVWPSR
jgi:hypothetical protein